MSEPQTAEPHWFGQIDRIERKIDGLAVRLTQLEKILSQLDDSLTALTAKVTAETTVIDSAITLINGIPALITAALASGATPAQLQAIDDLNAAITAKSAALALAVAQNTPTPGTP